MSKCVHCGGYNSGHDQAPAHLDTEPDDSGAYTHHEMNGDDFPIIEPRRIPPEALAHEDENIEDTWILIEWENI